MTVDIDIRGVSKQFGSTPVLKNTSLSVQKGEMVALLGPSGSGKTTLLRIISGLESPDSGEVVFFGQTASRLSIQNRRVGFVFQHYALFEHLNIFENIAFGLRVKPKKERLSPQTIHQKVSELLHLIQLDQFGNRYPSQLSGGQRQRVALARALAIEPRILLLDEPFGALDAKVRKDLCKWLQRLHKDIGITSVFVTHDIQEAMLLADRIVILKQGVIEQIGTPTEVYQHPKNAFIYQFIGNVTLFNSKESGQQAVRPYLLDIHLTKPEGVESLSAFIEDISYAGLVAKIDLVNEFEEAFEVEMTRDRCEALSLHIQDPVFVTLKQCAKTFLPDYDI